MADDKAKKTATEMSEARPVQQIPIKSIFIDDGFNARETTGLDKDSMAEFAENLRVNKLINPVTVRPITGDLAKKTGCAFALVAGFRRTKAAKALTWETIAATILPMETSDTEARITNVAENLIRDDLSLYEKSRSYVNLLEAGVKQTEIISRLGIGRSQSSVDNCIRIFKQLDPALKNHWKDPKSALGRKLSFSVLVDICKYPVRAEKADDMTQEKRLNVILGETDPAKLEALLRSGSGTGGKGDKSKKKKVGEFVRVRRLHLTKAFRAAEEKLPAEAMEGVKSFVDFILGRGGFKLTFRDDIIWSPENGKDESAPKKAKKGAKGATQKEAKA